VPAQETKRASLEVSMKDWAQRENKAESSSGKRQFIHAEEDLWFVKSKHAGRPKRLEWRKMIKPKTGLIGGKFAAGSGGNLIKVEQRRQSINTRS